MILDVIALSILQVERYYFINDQITRHAPQTRTFKKHKIAKCRSPWHLTYQKNPSKRLEVAEFHCVFARLILFVRADNVC